MHIEDKRRSSTKTRYGDLNYGEAYSYNNELYVKTKPVGGLNAALRLSDVTPVAGINADIGVFPLKAKVTIED